MENENVGSSIFDENDYEKLRQRGLSEERIENLQKALALVDLAEEVPNEDEVSALLDKVNAYFGDGTAEDTVQKYFDLAEKDPEFFQQLVVLQTFMGVTDTPIADTHVGDALRQIRQAEGEERQQLTNELFARIRKFDDKSKARFVTEIEELNKEEKKELLEILNKK